MSNNVTAGMSKNKFFSRLRADWERNNPIVLGLFAAAITMFTSPFAVSFMLEHEWNIAAAYAAFFDVAAVFTAFLFGFYTFVATSTTDFMLKVRRTQVFSGLKTFTVNAMSYGAWLIIVSIPMMIIEPIPTEVLSWENALFLVWMGLVVASVASFFRVMKLFLKLMSD
ncbi:MAG: hypothetical protein K0U61_08085 [Alphaproteobacteria bacterium]|nr:hypothetical protein [Alphaproteobacteria bacterium]